uniref:11-oxo-beta-amyrin 30-oxidase n=1 Tax=Kalanchoe fedtschenkoi TaxID=63787 RepID=A0A7N1A8Y4_KALFE
MKALDKDIKASLKVIIKEKEEAMTEGKGATSDLLGLLLESNLKAMKENKHEKDVGMSLEDVTEECKLFYFAGQETTSSLLVWTMILLSQYQGWQKRARDEVLQVFGNEIPNLDGLNHLKIVTMILNESRSLYPPATAVNRITRKEEVLGNLTLPAGVQVTVPILSIQRDPELWGEDANEFKPDRFSDGVSSATKGQVKFIPFSWGPRICIGQNFAVLEAKMAMTLILQQISFELSPSYTHAPYTRVTLQPQHGAHLILSKL